MELVPFTPVGQQKRSKLEVLAFHWSRKSFQTRLLPAAAGFLIAKYFVSADHAGIFEMKFFALPFGPEHEGRVAVGSPRHRDWAIGKPVLSESVLRQDSRRVSLRDLSIGYTD